MKACAGAAAETAAPRQRGWLWAYLVAFFIPMIGIVAGLYLYAQDDEGKRGAGTTCMLLSVFGFAWVILLWVYIIPALTAAKP
jgi:hypothetical protein